MVTIQRIALITCTLALPLTTQTRSIGQLAYSAITSPIWAGTACAHAVLKSAGMNPRTLSEQEQQQTNGAGTIGAVLGAFAPVLAVAALEKIGFIDDYVPDWSLRAIYMVPCAFASIFFCLICGDEICRGLALRSHLEHRMHAIFQRLLINVVDYAMLHDK
jgi:hypothetical protein